MNRLLCAIWLRHEASMLIITADGLYLRCPDCGYCSPGWDLTGLLTPQEPERPTNRAGFERKPMRKRDWRDA